MKTNPLCASLLTTLLLAGAASAQTINWVSTASTASAGNKSFLSDGTTMPGGFNFELGYFDTGYNAADGTTWASSWHALGTTVFNNPAPLFGYNFADNDTVTAGQTNFVGKQGYIWGYNNLSLMGQPGGEALLITNSTWTFPDPSNPVAFNWSVSNANTVVWGAVDGNSATAGGLITGAGEITAPKTVNSFHMQTATWAANPIPEPTTAGLLIMAGLAAARRRRR